MTGTQDVWAITEFGKPLQKIQQPIPEPRGTQVLVKVTHCGLCHSDLHFWEGFYELGGGKRFYLTQRGVELPAVMGHEILGNVARAGPDAESLVTIGSRRIVYPWVGCGKCSHCAQEDDNLCAKQRSLGVLDNGGFAEYVLLPHPRYLIDPGDVDPSVACTFGCSGLTAMGAISKALPLPPDEPVVLVGAGGLGLAAIALLKAHGHKNVISVDVADDKLSAAKKAGATGVVNTSGPEPGKDIIAAAGGPVLAVVDFVNNSQTAAMVDTILAKNARWIQVGGMGGSVELRLISNILRGLSIFAHITGSVKQLREVTRLAREKQLPPLPVTTMPWDSVSEAMDILRAGKVTGRIVLVRE